MDQSQRQIFLFYELFTYINYISSNRYTTYYYMKEMGTSYIQFLLCVYMMFCDNCEEIENKLKMIY